MSVSILAVALAIAVSPAALVAREAVGHEKFDAWLESGNIKVKTDFKSETEWKDSVLKAGYDMASLLGSPKTHFKKSTNDYFLWETKNGEITAVFSKYDNMKEIIKFISSVEKVVGRKVFDTSVLPVFEAGKMHKTETAATEKLPIVNTQKENPTPISHEKKVFTLPTVINDEAVLVSTLEILGAMDISQTNDKVTAHFRDGSFIFSRTEGSPYTLTIECDNDNAAVLDIFHNIDTEYGLQVQNNTYMTLKQNCEDKGYEITDEEVLEDNSIVLTISI